MFHKVNARASFIGSFRLAETRSQWERWNTDGILIHRHSLGPPLVLKMVILSNLLALHRRVDFLESYLTAVLASGLPCGGKTAPFPLPPKKKEEINKKEMMLQFAIHTHWGKCLIP